MEDLSPLTQRVRQVLEGLDIGFELRQFEESTRTSQDAADTIGCDVGQIAKSIAFSSGSRPVLVIASGRNRIDLKKVEQELGESIAMMKPEQVKEVTGFAVGGVPPVGHNTSMETFIDQDLMGFDIVWAAAGTPNSIFSVKSPDLARITSGRVIDLRE